MSEVQKVIEMLEELRDNAQQVYDSKTVEDYGQLINQSGEMEVLEVIQLIKDKLEDLKDLDQDKEGNHGN